MSIEGFLSKHPQSTLTRTRRVLVVNLIATVDTSVDQVQVVNFNVVAIAEIVRVLVLLDVRVDVVKRAVGI